MPVFTLKSYEQDRDAKVESQKQEDSTQNIKDKQEQLKTVIIQANDSVAKIVATALYEKLGNDSDPEQKQEETESSQADAKVISTEDINRSPVDTWRMVKNTPNVVIVNNGFKTDKEEWFLTTLANAGTKVHYSVESYLKTLHLKQGV